jgi:hypothetical protein
MERAGTIDERARGRITARGVHGAGRAAAVGADRFGRRRIIVGANQRLRRAVLRHAHAATNAYQRTTIRLAVATVAASITVQRVTVITFLCWTTLPIAASIELTKRGADVASFAIVIPDTGLTS